MVNLTLFSLIMQLINRNLFHKAVDKYRTDKDNKGINSWTHLVTMIFCHLAKAQSIREITNAMWSINGNLNNSGILVKSPSRSSLSCINQHRDDWRMFRDFYFMLKEKLHAEGYFIRKKLRKINKKIYLLDSSIISVCSSVFDWAKYRQEKGAIKLHTLLDYEGCLPSYMFITEGKQSDIKHAQYRSLPRSSVIVVDRGYQVFKMLYQWKIQKIIVVIRLKKSIKYERQRELTLPENKNQHILKDGIILLTEEDTKLAYAEIFRRVVVYEQKNNQTIELITNNFSWTASTIAELYEQRWMIEIFLKELKQHLKIKSFFGMNENAMMIQI